MMVCMYDEALYVSVLGCTVTYLAVAGPSLCTERRNVHYYCLYTSGVYLAISICDMLALLCVARRRVDVYDD